MCVAFEMCFWHDIIGLARSLAVSPNRYLSLSGPTYKENYEYKHRYRIEGRILSKHFCILTKYISKPKFYSKILRLNRSQSQTKG